MVPQELPGFFIRQVGRGISHVFDMAWNVDFSFERYDITVQLFG